MQLPRDFADLLAAFAGRNVRYLVVGGYAMAAHDVPRFTKDIDLLLAQEPDNVRRGVEALAEFGAPADVVSALAEASADDVVWLGQPPLRIDLLLTIPGVDFDRAWPRRHDVRWGDVEVHVLGFDDLLASKRASGRPHDLRDAEALEKSARTA